MAQVSVIIPVFNKATTIQKTIESVLAQTFTDFELLLVNDASTDNSLAIIEQFRDSRIQLINQEHKGVSYTRNTGIKASKSPFVAFLDADDIWQQNHLENMIQLSKNHFECAVFSSGYSVIYPNKIRNFNFKTAPKNPMDFFENSLDFSLLNNSNIMIKKTVFDTVGYYDTSYPGGEDTELWIRMMLKYKLCFSNEITVTINKNLAQQASAVLTNYHKVDYVFHFLKEENNNALKKYMDLQRYALLIRFKKQGKSHPEYHAIHKVMNTKNLNLKQRVLLALPTKVIATLQNLV